MHESPDSNRGNVAITATIFWLWLCCSSVALADSKKSEPNEFPANPLEITTPDPLLPRPAVNQRLTPPERLKLAAALDELNQQAQANLEAGDRVGAFAIWNRELRLRRALGYLEEVEALGRVGGIAWSENQTTEVQIITGRLQAIRRQTKSQPPVDLKLLRSLGGAFEQVRSPKSAVEVYEQILAVAQQQQDIAAKEATLEKIAELHLAWFDYPQAAANYKELLGLARAKSNRVDYVRYLQQLAYIYEQAKQYQQAVAVRQQLAKFYLNEEQFTQLPALRLLIGSDYQALGQLKQAFQNYQEAYASAWSLQQYYRAAEALRNLVALYRSQEQLDAALETSRILLEADGRASNLYGLMNTYDQIGRMYLKQGNYSEALAAFQNGLEFAKQLKYQEAYFAEQISQVRKRVSK
jgi:tetratricopeptide (TPR) repeat protein